MEQFRPIGEGLVRGNNRAGLFIPVGNKSEEQIAFLPADGRITHFINNHQGRLVITTAFSWPPGFMIFLEFFDQIFHVREVNAHTELTGFQSQ